MRDKPFPPRKINKPPIELAGLWIGICVFCGGSLGFPAQEDLFHEECLAEAEAKRG
jgi:hypothetical protein